MPENRILILGGGINGATAARELVLNGQNVWLVDTADLTFGATAYSSRLIHGGLRYLEFAEFSLVKESLVERGRLLKLAPHLVKPLRLFIPVRNSWGGFTAAAGKFLGLPIAPKKTVHRGLRVVQVGLWLYDRYARTGDLPARSLHRPGESGVPRVNPNLARRLWAYSDAQITFPERMVIDFLADARRLAAEKGLDFRVFTYTEARLAADGRTIELRPAGNSTAEPIEVFEPAAIINATGAWVDDTLRRLPAPSRQLMGGTKGSHFLTFNPRLGELLAGHGIYTEASDGRPVFILPLLEGTLVGTTDIPFRGDPRAAVASEEELSYLLAAVSDVLPDAGLSRGDIAMHYCGVRPLPFVDARTPAAITRRHQLVWSDECRVPLVSLVGGKLTTCRSLAEETAAAVLGKRGMTAELNSRDRPIPRTPVDDCLFEEPTAWASAAQWAAEHEWVTRLEDLVERRLMWHLSPGLSRARLSELADILIQQGRLDAREKAAAIERCTNRLQSHFGIVLNPEP
ncbi:MAG: FAD-dependent oxidoreductase [Planctomycetaceae bacterium]|nr:FAD-dependent oxidoreductase [Planctomycetaceae bacterium]